MTLNAILFLGMMCRDINLEYNICRSRGINIMTSSAKFPAAFLCDVSQLEDLMVVAGSSPGGLRHYGWPGRLVHPGAIFWRCFLLERKQGAACPESSFDLCWD